MPFAVVLISQPLGKINNTTGQWPAFLAEVSGISPPPGDHKRPTEGVWLLTLPIDTPVLAAIIYLATGREVPHRVLYFDDLPSEYSYVSPLR
ncbi:MAG: hypothetical protein Q7T38_11980 [Gallionella sp.]|nr:hypothetical protein [Gallionella sp.]